MRSFRVLFPFFVIAASSVSATQTYLRRAPAGIQWKSCNEAALEAPLECGTLDVPLDYTEPESNETLKLRLTKFPAASQRKKGSILLNFGGPGNPGRGPLSKRASMMQQLTGGHYDLVAFDPRGTATTIPFSCVDTEIEGVEWMNEDKLGNASDTQLGRIWSRADVNANKCLKRANETGRLMGTAFVARDLMSTVDALGEDGMLRYWGISYGTALGATVAAMFPDRIDKMVLDAVQNPHEYYHSLATYEQWSDTDKVYYGLFTSCVEAGDKCPLTAGRKNVTAAELERDVRNLMREIKDRPVSFGTSMLDYTSFKGLLMSAFYDISQWPALTRQIQMLLEGNTTQEISLTENPLENLPATMAVFGIQCGDRIAKTSSFDEFREVARRLSRVSDIAGDFSTSIHATCSQWKLDAKERYEGDFHAKTKNPMLLLANTHDGHTPIRSARNVSSGFEGSVVLEINGYGHGSTSVPSKCTLKTVSSYWNDGTLPDPGTVCEVDAHPFAGVTWQDVFKEVSNNGTEKNRTEEQGPNTDGKGPPDQENLPAKPEPSSAAWKTASVEKSTVPVAVALLGIVHSLI